MNKKKMEYFKKLLLKKRKEMMEQMAIIKEAEMTSTLKESTGDHSSYAFHMADQGTDCMEREKNFFYAQRDGRLLYHIDKALERIDEGVFGRCDSCGEDISSERLEAVPHARLCIKCKSSEENHKNTSSEADE